LGNFFTIREVLKEYHPEVIRYLMIASHYRSPLNYSTEQLDNAKAALDRFYSLLRTVTATEAAEKEDYSERFYHAMADDFNTPEALAVLFDLVREINRLKSLDEVAAKFSSIIAKDGPDAVAFYVSGQLLTEDYYVANKLMKGFIGSGNIDTNSRLCMSSAVAAHKRAFGEDVVPGCYEDFEEADLVVLVGSNTAWCHPILYRRLLAARESRGTRIVVIDPRRTATCDEADLHLAIRPGADLALFNALFCELALRGGENLVAMLGNQGLVGSDDMLARSNGGHNQPVGGLVTSDQLHHDLDLRVADDVLGIGGQGDWPAAEATLLVGVTHSGAHHLDTAAGTALDLRSRSR
jgi:hypothetical protein